MAKMDEFKNFVKTKPALAHFIENGQMTWQKFYEIYDLYGEKSEVWNKYLVNDERRSTPNVTEGIEKITNLVKNVDMESIKSHINSAQKAIDFMQDLTVKKGINSNSLTNNLNKGPVSPRPLNKFFED